MPITKWWFLWPFLSHLTRIEGLLPCSLTQCTQLDSTKTAGRVDWATGRIHPPLKPLMAKRRENSEHHETQEAHDEDGPTLRSFLKSINETVYDVSDNSIRSFNMDLYNLAMDDPFAAKDAIAYLQESSLLSPNSASFGIVLEGFIQNHELQAADDFLFRSNSSEHAPSLHECMRLMNAYKEATTDTTTAITDGAERAECIMRRYKGDDDKAKLMCVAVEAWCQLTRGKGDLALRRAEALLEEMEQDQASDTSRLYAYTSYMVGLSKSSRRKKASIAQEIYDTKIAQPDIVAVTALLNCWAKTRDYGERLIAGDRAIAILDDLEAHDYLKANVVTYRTAIAAIGNSMDPSKAEDIIRIRMPRNGIEADTKTYNAWLISAVRDAKRAIEILESMPVEPDVQTWGAVLRTCDPERAQSLVDKMERLYKEGKSKVMNAWKRSKAPDALEKIESILKKMEDGYAKSQTLDIRPNSLSYATYVDALIRYAGSDAAERAEATVERMLKLYATGLGYVRPTRQIFNALINAWARSEANDAPIRAEKVFHWMEDQYEKSQDPSLRPDELSLCGVLNAWATHAKNGGSERAVEVLKHAERVPEQERGFPITLTMYNSKKPFGALMPLTLAFAAVIKAIARSEDAKSAQKAEAVMLNLEQECSTGRSTLKPDTVTYSSVINACAYCARSVLGTNERADAMKIALRAYNKLNEDPSEQANHIVYGTLFKAINSLIPVSDSREELVRTLFKRCCDAGYVDGFVLSQMRSSCNSLFDEIQSEYGKHDISKLVQRIPTQWTVNAI